MVEKIPLIEKFIGWFGKTFFERSGYKADLHEDLRQLIMEIKNLNIMVYALTSEYKHIITLYKFDGKERRR